MLLADRINSAEVQSRKVADGLSLVRRCYDHKVVAACCALAAAFPEINPYAESVADSRVSLPVLPSKELRRHGAQLGTLDLTPTLTQLVAQVPSLVSGARGIVQAVAVVRARSNRLGPFYVEARLSQVSDLDPGEDSSLWSENRAVRTALAAQNPTATGFNWSKNGPDMTVAMAPADLSEARRLELETRASELLVGLEVKFTATHLTLPNMEGGTS